MWDVGLFAVSAGLIVAAGIRLARDGDVIAAGTGLGGLWVGAILVAAAALAALVILLAAPLLASSTVALADRLGISRGFAGLMLLAVTTSLPEAVVTTASVRRESYDLAVGNLLGSNCFNMAALVPLEIANGGRSILADAGPDLVVAALVGMLLTGLAMLGVLDRAERARRGIELAPLVAVLTYVIGLVLSYRSGS